MRCTGWKQAALVLALAVGTACTRKSPPGPAAPAARPLGDGGSASIKTGSATAAASSVTDDDLTIRESFEDLYPIFLLRRIDTSTRAALWSHYRGRWVRWSGKLIAQTRDG